MMIFRISLERETRPPDRAEISAAYIFSYEREIGMYGVCVAVSLHTHTCNFQAETPYEYTRIHIETKIFNLSAKLVTAASLAVSYSAV